MGTVPPLHTLHEGRYPLCLSVDVLSEEHLTRNMAALAKVQGRCPALGGLADSLRVAVANGGLHVEVRTSRDGWQPMDDPSEDAAARWLKEGVTPGATQAIVVGAGLGYSLEAAARLGITRVIAVEPHPGVATLLLSRRDWREWFDRGRLRLLTGPEYAGATDVARFLDGLADIPVVVHPRREKWEPEAIARARAVATRVAQNAQANGQARRKFAGPYLRQTLANLPVIGREADAAALDGVFAGVPAVVVAAGPSLDENVKDLAALQDRALIVTADTALGPLVAGGVRPHIAVAVDSSALNARHLTSVRDTARIALAAEGSVHPSAFDAFQGRTFTFRLADHEPWPWLRLSGIRRAEIKTWGSVLTSAFHLARRMGADPIVFVGADLAFTGMRPYCRHTIYDAVWQEWIDKGCTWELLMADYFSRQPEVWRPDVHGVETRTAPHLASFRDWLVEQTASLPGRFINATGAGLLYGGRIEQQSLADVLGSIAPQPDLHAAVAARHAWFTSRSGDAARVARLQETARTKPESLPLERWRQFAVGTVTREEILDSIAGAAC